MINLHIKKIGFWLPLVVLLCVIIFLFSGFNGNSMSASDNYTIPYDPFALGFEENCYDCHAKGFEGTYYYCHELIPSSSYISRVYLKIHYIWVATTLNVPTSIYMPPEVPLGQTEVDVNIFGQALYPASINIPIGATVTWHNLDNKIHNVNSGNIIGSDIQPFSSGNIEPGASFSYTFNEEGIFYYKRTFIPSVDLLPENAMYGVAHGRMVGRIVVGEPSSQKIVTEVSEDIIEWIEGHE
jgi:plastocyanin